MADHLYELGQSNSLDETKAYLETVSWLKSKKKLLDKCLWKTCELNRYDFAEWLISIGAPIDHSKCFFHACNNNSLEMIKLLINHGADVKMRNNLILFKACEYDNLEIANFIIEHTDIDIKKYTNKIINMCCDKSSLKLLEFFISKKLIDLDSEEYYHAFHSSCDYGHISIVKLLYNSVPIDEFYIRMTNYIELNDCLVSVVRNGHLELAKWLYNLDIFDINNEILYIEVCSGGHINMLELLNSLETISIDIQKKGFEYACYNNHLDMAKWLYELVNIDLDNEFYDEFIIKMCENINNMANYKNYDVILWICSKCPRYHVIIEENGTIIHNVKDKFQLELEKKTKENIIKKSDLNETCLICKETDKIMIQLECTHFYCMKCLERYMKLKDICCYCQKIIIKDTTSVKIYNTS